MSIVSLVIAPYIAVSGGGITTTDDCCKKDQTEMTCANDTACVNGKCDMKICATLTKEQCAKMCDSLGCSAEEKTQCMTMYNAQGQFIGSEDACCKGDAATCEKDKDQAATEQGCSGEKECSEKNDKTCSKGIACCKGK